MTTIDLLELPAISLLASAYDPNIRLLKTLLKILCHCAVEFQDAFAGRKKMVSYSTKNPCNNNNNYNL